MKKILIAVTLSLAVFILGSSEFSQVHSYTTGAPIQAGTGYTGSPFDGKTCAVSGCHAGTATQQTGLITTAIPAEGYISGETYDVTATISQAGISKFGFMLSPQDGSGNLMGTMTETTSTQLKANGKYMTHLSTSTAGTDSKAWTFQWTAPTTGNGPVNFYAAFNAANGNGNASGDDIYFSDLSVVENLNTGISSLEEAGLNVALYPNPVVAGQALQMDISTERQTTISLEAWTLAGQKVASLIQNQDISGQLNTTSMISSQLSSGTYLIRISTPGHVGVERLVVR